MTVALMEGRTRQVGAGEIYPRGCGFFVHSGTQLPMKCLNWYVQ